MEHQLHVGQIYVMRETKTGNWEGINIFITDWLSCFRIITELSFLSSYTHTKKEKLGSDKHFCARHNFNCLTHLGLV